MSTLKVTNVKHETSGLNTLVFDNGGTSGGNIEINFLPVNMRATPTATRLSGVYFGGESSTAFSSIQTLTTSQSTDVLTLVYVIQNTSDANCGGKYAFTAEL